MVQGTHGWILHLMGRTAEAIEINEETIRMHEDFQPGYVMLGLAYEAAQRYEKAIQSFETAYAMDSRPVALAAAGHTFGVWKKEGKARQIIRRLTTLAQTEPVSSYFLALVQIGLGEEEDAISYLGDAQRENCDWLIQLGVDPRWKPLHGHQKFRRLLQRVGLALANQK